MITQPFSVSQLSAGGVLSKKLTPTGVQSVEWVNVTGYTFAIQNAEGVLQAIIPPYTAGLKNVALPQQITIDNQVIPYSVAQPTNPYFAYEFNQCSGVEYTATLAQPAPTVANVEMLAMDQNGVLRNPETVEYGDGNARALKSVLQIDPLNGSTPLALLAQPYANYQAILNTYPWGSQSKEMQQSASGAMDVNIGNYQNYVAQTELSGTATAGAAESIALKVPGNNGLNKWLSDLNFSLSAAPTGNFQVYLTDVSDQGAATPGAVAGAGNILGYVLNLGAVSQTYFQRGGAGTTTFLTPPASYSSWYINFLSANTTNFQGLAILQGTDTY